MPSSYITAQANRPWIRVSLFIDTSIWYSAADSSDAEFFHQFGAKAGYEPDTVRGTTCLLFERGGDQWHNALHRLTHADA